MRKVVLKVRLKNRDKFEEKLDRAGIELGQVIWGHDRVYLPRGYKRGGNYPRFILRTEMKAVDRPAKYYLIQKRHIEDANIEVVHQTEVKDYLEAVGMMREMGFSLAGEVSRKRQGAKLSGGEMLYVDNIDNNTGNYAKIEARVLEMEKVEAVRRKVLDIYYRLEEDRFLYQTYLELLKK